MEHNGGEFLEKQVKEESKSAGSDHPGGREASA